MKTETKLNKSTLPILLAAASMGINLGDSSRIITVKPIRPKKVVAIKVICPACKNSFKSKFQNCRCKCGYQFKVENENLYLYGTTSKG